MNAAHLHLMLNHLPILGTLFGAAILGIALWLRNSPFQKVALVFFVLLGLAGIAVYWSGGEAADWPGLIRITQHLAFEVARSTAA